MTSRPLRVAVAQIDTTVGDFDGNSAKILDLGRRAESEGAAVVVFPELAVAGYPPRDLVERRTFLREASAASDRIARAAGDALWVFGSVAPNASRSGRSVFNVAVAARRGRVVAEYRKRLLPNYDVFDEARYFEPGDRPLVVRAGARRIAITICEDIWNDKTFWKQQRRLYDRDPVADVKRAAADLHVNLSASPWVLGKDRFRERMMRQIARGTRAPLVSCNLVGGNDGLVFDGSSIAFDASGRLAARSRPFVEDFWTVDLPDGKGPLPRRQAPVSLLRQALVLALSDYASKCGFRTAVLGISGGIDSAVTAALAVESLGSGNVTGVAMPGPYSSKGSLRDARALAEALRIELLEIPISPVFESYRSTLRPAFGKEGCSEAEENLQARIRGALLMALSNRNGHLVLSTGNKSELAVGYCTLYGDMAGGYALLSDVPKTLVYELARDFNRENMRIPQASIDKEPSAELRPNQKDSDSLPPYEMLDPLIEALVEDSLAPAAAARRAGVPLSLASDIARRIDRNEYKRRQAPPGPKVTGRAFGEGRRYPIAQKFEIE
ncbi:MAG: NAD+ synthase [Thermoanaerobaculia bacterium]